MVKNMLPVPIPKNKDTPSKIYRRAGELTAKWLQCLLTGMALSDGPLPGWQPLQIMSDKLIRGEGVVMLALFSTSNTPHFSNSPCIHGLF